MNKNWRDWFIATTFWALVCIGLILMSPAARAEWQPPAWTTATGAWIEEHTGGSPYLDIGIAYQLDDMSDWYLQTDREWQCSQNWQARIGFGLEWDHVSLGYHHSSWWVCGGPWWDDRPELYSDVILLNYRFGGK